MQKKQTIVFASVAIIAAAVGGFFLLKQVHFFLPYEYSKNPDPNHTHADFAVWIEGQKLDFSERKYMSGVSYDETSHDEEHEYLHPHLHLHDGIGHVIHTHKPGLTIGEFFDSLGFGMSESCFRLENGITVCPEQGKSWRMFVLNPTQDTPSWQERTLDPGYVFADMDQILLTYQGSDEMSALRITQQQQEMTEDACLYSQTCPWRGKPPTENCIADPEVPCVAPPE